MSIACLSVASWNFSKTKWQPRSSVALRRKTSMFVLRTTSPWLRLISPHLPVCKSKNSNVLHGAFFFIIV